MNIVRAEGCLAKRQLIALQLTDPREGPEPTGQAEIGFQAPDFLARPGSGRGSFRPDGNGDTKIERRT